jgi:hypothetical protein
LDELNDARCEGFHLEVVDEPFIGYIVKCPRDVKANVTGGIHTSSIHAYHEV